MAHISVRIAKANTNLYLSPAGKRFKVVSKDIRCGWYIMKNLAQGLIFKPSFLFSNIPNLNLPSLFFSTIFVLFQVIVNKKPAEMLGVMIVESGWGSMIPCAIIAHLAKDGPAAKSGRLNVGDQILSVNGTSLVGLPLLECQNIIKVMM